MADRTTAGATSQSDINTVNEMNKAQALGQVNNNPATGTEQSSASDGSSTVSTGQSAPPLNQTTSTGPAKHTLGPHESDILNVLDPRVKPEPKLMRQAGGDHTGPAPSTLGPHESDLANILDPRVKPDTSKLGHQKDAVVDEEGKAVQSGQQS